MIWKSWWFWYSFAKIIYLLKSVFNLGLGLQILNNIILTKTSKKFKAKIEIEKVSLSILKNIKMFKLLAFH